MIFTLLLSLQALAGAQENITQENITQELNADLSVAFQDILSSSNQINNSMQPSTSSPFADAGSIDSDADFIAAEQLFNSHASFASLSGEERERAREMWHLYLIESGRMPWIALMPNNPLPWGWGPY